MTQTKVKPARGNGTGFGDVFSYHACDASEHIATHTSPQAQFAARWLARRAPVSLAMASTIVELHGLGGAHAR